MIEDLKARWDAGDFFHEKLIERVDGENFLRESIETIKEPEDFYQPSKRINIINSFASELDQIQDDERIVEVEFVQVSDKDHKKEKEILEEIANIRLKFKFII